MMLLLLALPCASPHLSLSPKVLKAVTINRCTGCYITQRRTTLGRTPLDEWLGGCRDLYLTTHNTHNKHPCPRWESKPQSQQVS